MKNPDAVDVICQHCRDGSIIPMRIRVRDDEGLNQVYNIKSFTALTQDKILLPNEVMVTSDILRFDCEIEVFNIVKKIRLHYNKSRVKWSIFF